MGNINSDYYLLHFGHFCPFKTHHQNSAKNTPHKCEPDLLQHVTTCLEMTSKMAPQRLPFYPKACTYGLQVGLGVPRNVSGKTGGPQNGLRRPPETPKWTQKDLQRPKNGRKRAPKRFPSSSNAGFSKSAKGCGC